MKPLRHGLDGVSQRASEGEVRGSVLRTPNVSYLFSVVKFFAATTSYYVQPATEETSSTFATAQGVKDGRAAGLRTAVTDPCLVKDPVVGGRDLVVLINTTLDPDAGRVIGGRKVSTDVVLRLAWEMKATSRSVFLGCDGAVSSDFGPSIEGYALTRALRTEFCSAPGELRML